MKNSKIKELDGISLCFVCSDIEYRSSIVIITVHPDSLDQVIDSYLTVQTSDL